MSGAWIAAPFKAVTAYANSITRELQGYVSKAAKMVDNMGDAAFTKAQLAAIQKNPKLRPMFRGNRIDVLARDYIKKSGITKLKSNYTRGPDFVNTETGRWWDMTTKAAWQNHVNKYGPFGTLLKTK